MELARTFDGVAALYDAERPGYSRELFVDLVALAGLSRGDPVLEVGCGSGQATAGLAGCGLDITAIDPGVELIGLAKARMGSVANVRFAVSTFEDWPVVEGACRLIAAGQSWHWVDKQIGFAKAADALQPKGCLAVFGHTPVWPRNLLSKLEPVYRRMAPELWVAPPESWYLPDGPLAEMFAASGRFAPVQHRGYAWRRTYAPESFVAYLATRSDYNVLSAERRGPLLTAIENLLAADHAQVTIDWTTNLYLAQVLGRS